MRHHNQLNTAQALCICACFVDAVYLSGAGLSVPGSIQDLLKEIQNRKQHQLRVSMTGLEKLELKPLCLLLQ